MKLWRKLAKKQYDPKVGAVVRNGRQIKYMHQMQEYLFKNEAKVYPLLAQILVHSGIATIAPAQPDVNAETVNEAV